MLQRQQIMEDSWCVCEGVCVANTTDYAGQLEGVCVAKTTDYERQVLDNFYKIYTSILYTHSCFFFVSITSIFHQFQLAGLHL